MADVLRTRVVGPVMLPDGSAAPNGAKLIFTLRGWDKQDGALIMRGPKEAPVLDGEIEVDLQRTSASDRQTLYDVGYSYFNAASRNWENEPLGAISLTGEGPFDLVDLLALPAPVPNVPDALAQALGAAASTSADAVKTDADREATAADVVTTGENVGLAQLAAAETVNSAPFAKADASTFLASTSVVNLGRYWSKDGKGLWDIRDDLDGDVEVAGVSADVVETQFPSPEAFGWKRGKTISNAARNGAALSKCLAKFGVAFLSAGIAYCVAADFPREGGSIFGVEGKTRIYQPDDGSNWGAILAVNRTLDPEHTENAQIWVSGVRFIKETRDAYSASGDTIQHRHMLRLGAISNSRITRCEFIGFQGDGIYLGKGGIDPETDRHNYNVVIDHCLFDGIDRKNRNGVSVIDGTGVKILYNHYARVSSQYQPGPIDIEPNSVTNTKILGIEIGHNTFEDCGGSNGNISVYLPDIAYDVQPSGFHIHNNTGVGGIRGLFFAHGGDATASRNHDVTYEQNHWDAPTSRAYHVRGVNNFRARNNTMIRSPNPGFIGFNVDGQKCMNIRMEGDAYINCGRGSDGRIIMPFTVDGLELVRIRFEDCGKADGTYGVPIEFGTGASSRVSIIEPEIVNSSMLLTGLIVKQVGHTYAPGGNSFFAGSKDYSGLSINFAAHFSDYLWTSYSPIAGGTTAAGVGTYTRQFGRWRSQGKRVEWQCELIQTGHTGTGTLLLQLPTRASPSSNNELRPVPIMLSGVTATGGTVGAINPGQTLGDTDHGAVHCYQTGTGSTSVIAVPSGAATFRAAGEYIAA